MRELHLYRLGRVLRWFFPSSWRPSAVTIWFTIVYLVPPTPALRRHEMVHVQQARQLGVLRFWWLYLRETIRHGYRDNAFERAARAAEEE